MSITTEPGGRVRGCGIAAPFDFLAPPSWRAIAKLVALKHGVRITDISGRDRHKAYVGARYEALRLVHSHCAPLTIAEIGRRFNRDRSTVYYALKIGRSAYAH